MTDDHTATLTRLSDKLDRQYAEIEAMGPGHPEYGAREDRWIRILKKYERIDREQRLQLAIEDVRRAEQEYRERESHGDS